MKSFIKILSLLLSVCFIQSCTISPFSDDVVLSVNERKAVFTGVYDVQNKELRLDEYGDVIIAYQLSIPNSGRIIEIGKGDYWYDVEVGSDYIYVSINVEVTESKLENTPIVQLNGRFTISYKDQVIPIDVRLDIDY